MIGRLAYRRRSNFVGALRVGLAVTAAAWGALALGGCASDGGLVNMWKDPENPKTPLKNLFVVALKPDPTRRRLMEDGFVAALAKYDVKATASYRQFEDALPDTDQVIEAVRANGYDGVIVVSKLPTEQNEVYVPGYSTREARTRFNRWTGQYYTYWIDVTHPGVTESEQVVRHQIDVWSSAEGGRLVWSAVGEKVDPSSFDRVNKEITSQVVPELAKKGVVGK